MNSAPDIKIESHSGSINSILSALTEAGEVELLLRCLSLPGMSLRDYFAVAAIDIVSFDPESGLTRRDTEIARAAYAFADAMLAEREKELP